MKQTLYTAMAAAVLMMGFGESVQAQHQRLPKTSPLTRVTAKRPIVKGLPNNDFRGIPYLAPNPNVAESMGATFNPGRSFGTNVKIGQTQYDLQSNSAIPTRILNHGDGTISTSWTFSSEPGTPWSDRGMAYHYFDGTNWVSNPAYETVAGIDRVEPVRTGFGALGRVAGVGDIIVSHQTTVDALQVSRNTSLGATQSWISTAETGMPFLWPRTAVGGPDGKTVHIIALTIPSAGDFGGTPYNGIDGALLYNRSTDGGQTFDDTYIQVPGMDSTIFGGVGGDAYAIDARGNTVAFVTGDLTTSVMMWKSTDNGVTWDSTTVLRFPYGKWEDQVITDLDGDGDVDSVLVNGQFVTEGVFVSDGAPAILIDNQDKVHVWFGGMIMANDDTTDNSVSYFPGTSGIYYWNEEMGADSTRLIADIVDDNEDGLFDIGIRYSNNGPIPYGAGLTTFPSAGIDNSGALFLSYSGSKEGLDFRPTGASYKHLYMVKSTDGGLTWTGPTDISADESAGFDPFGEYSFPAIAKNVDDRVHVIYQFDYFPGSAVTIDNNAVHPFDNANDIFYIGVDKNEIGVGLKPVAKQAFDAALMPNPSNEATRLSFNLESASTVNIRISNMLGQTVETLSSQKLGAGNHSFTLNTAALKSGVYLVNIDNAQQSNTLKLVVKH